VTGVSSKKVQTPVACRMLARFPDLVDTAALGLPSSPTDQPGSLPDRPARFPESPYGLWPVRFPASAPWSLGSAGGMLRPPVRAVKTDKTV